MDFEPDIIHAHDIKATIYASLFSKKCKIISHVHGNSIDMRKTSLKSLLFLIVSKKVEHIFWVSDSSLSQYKFYKQICNKSSVLVNVVDKKEIIYNSKKFNIDEKYDAVFVGRLVKLKNPKRLLNIFLSVVGKVPTAKLAIVGNGPMYDELKEYYGKIQYSYSFNLNGSRANRAKTEKSIQKQLQKKFANCSIESRELSRESFYELYGGFLFIGIFLGIIFLMATTLIIYYKQISEGYDDRERYPIMQKVGMSKKEVRQSIRSQVLLVFFLPLIMAVIHLAFAFKIITRLLSVLNLTNISLFFMYTVGTVAVFAVIYVIIYSITAREYYKIIICRGE